MDYPETHTPVTPLFKINNFHSAESGKNLVTEIYTGLAAKQKRISSRFFYNESGSELFEAITELPEYYLTRTEKSILRNYATEIVDDFREIDLIELGSGDCSKISILLDAIPKNKIKKVRYIPVDVSKSAILKSADILSMNFPELKIHGLLADFMKHLDQLPFNRKRLICFFGSTIGNLTHDQAKEFIVKLRKIMRPGDGFWLGLDMVKNIQVLHDAYNDKQGITSLFNKNILNVVNDVAGTDFDPLSFEHVAWYNEKKARVEMHLEALKDMVITSNLFNEKIFLQAGETIHTENSHKFTLPDIKEFAIVAGLKIEKIYTDSREWFSLVKFKL